MGRIMNLSLTAALVTALALTGACANISDDRTRTQAEGGLAGAGIGGLLGAALGGAIDGRSGAVKGGLIGAGVGTVAGLAYGTSVANKKAQYATEEEWLSACLAEVKNANQQAAAYNSRLQATLAGYRQGGASSGYDSTNPGTSGRNQNKKAVQSELKESGEMLAYLDRTISSQQQVVSSTGTSAQTKQLQQQINEMLKQKQLLEQQNRELAAISNRMAI